MPRPNLRKRPHSEAFSPEADLFVQVETSAGPDGDAEEATAEGDESGTRDQEIWEAFKEEHHEAVEQLPLYLYRSFSLMRELDDNVQQYQNRLLQLIRTYLALRRSQTTIAAAAAHSHDNSKEEPESPAESVPQSSSGPVPAHLSTRKLLSGIARVAAEWLHAADEKLSISQAAYNSVDRHVRALDIAIPEQTSALSASSRPASAVQRRSSVHAGVQNFKDGSSPISTSIVQLEPTPTPSDQFDSKPSRRTRGRPLGSRNRRPTNSVTPNSSVDNPESKRGGVDPVTSVSGPILDMGVVPFEPVYCVCQGVSFGEMIACDGDKCAREWFHYECVGLTEAPKGKWHCPDCLEGLAKQARKKK